MAAFSTSYGKTFEVVLDELNAHSVKVCDCTTYKPICVIQNVEWWDKDDIQKALEDYKHLILSKMEEKGIGVEHVEKSPVKTLEEVVTTLAKTMKSVEDFKFCAEHIGLAISKLKEVA